LLNDLIVRATKLANIHGRYEFAKELALGEIHRILESRDFAKNYIKVEWTAESLETCTTFNDLGFKKLVVCLQNDQRIDISERVDPESTTLSCVTTDCSVDDVKVTVKDGLITVSSLTPIIAIRGFYKPPIDPEDNWLVKEHPHIIVNFLRWQLLADIDANSANVGYMTYSRMLKHLEREKVLSGG
jgi:hypothetical protein